MGATGKSTGTNVPGRRPGKKSYFLLDTVEKYDFLVRCLDRGPNRHNRPSEIELSHGSPAEAGTWEDIDESIGFGRRARGGCTLAHGRRDRPGQTAAGVRRQRRVRLLESRRGWHGQGPGRAARLHPRIQIPRSVVSRQPAGADGRSRHRRRQGHHGLRRRSEGHRRARQDRR